MAPMQGFTDFVYRKAHAEIIGGIDKYFCPYISFGKQAKIKNSQIRDILPENNTAIPVVPQVLFSNAGEFRQLCKLLTSYGYSGINLNLGCPYPMVTNRGRGAAILQNPGLLNEILGIAFHEFEGRFSVKLRSGLESEDEIFPVTEVLNRFPVSEVIYHPRLATQMYKGEVNAALFRKVKEISCHPLVFNGDILSEADLLKIQELVPSQKTWMIGRGVLQNPFLPRLLKGERIEMKNEKLLLFHEKIFSGYASRLEGSGHLLQKMEQFWEYFSASFVNPHKVFKLVKKAGTVSAYNKAVKQIFADFLLNVEG